MTFNLHKYGSLDEHVVLVNELELHNIVTLGDGKYLITIGETDLEAPSLQECKSHIRKGIKEIKEILWSLWHDLSSLSSVIASSSAGNNGSIGNILFLHNLKKTYLLSLSFTGLKDVSKSLSNVFDLDLVNVHENLISKFNLLSTKIRLIHHLVMLEIYRLQLVNKYMKLVKTAQVAGPWANVDLPMKERMWEWDEDGEEEYFGLREKARKEQVRYNPETVNGFYYIWQDRNRDPYRFEDMLTDSPYKSLGLGIH